MGTIQKTTQKRKLSFLVKHQGKSQYLTYKNWLLTPISLNFCSICVVLIINLFFNLDLLIWVLERLINIYTFVPTFAQSITNYLQFEAAASIIAACCLAIAAYLLHQTVRSNCSISVDRHQLSRVFVALPTITFRFKCVEEPFLKLDVNSKHMEFCSRTTTGWW